MYNFVSSAGVVSQEDNTLYTDNGTHVAMQFTTSWIKFNTLAGFGRLYNIYLIGEQVTSGTSFTVEQQFDLDSSSWSTAFSYESSEFPSIRIPTLRQKSSAYRFRVIEETEAMSPGEGMEFTGLTLELGQKQTGQRIAYADGT